jgi:hypothetical protein
MFITHLEFLILPLMDIRKSRKFRALICMSFWRNLPYKRQSADLSSLSKKKYNENSEKHRYAISIPGQSYGARGNRKLHVYSGAHDKEQSQPN